MVLKLYYKQHFLFNLKSMITLCLVLKPATQTCLFLVSLKQITPWCPWMTAKLGRKTNPHLLYQSWTNKHTFFHSKCRQTNKQTNQPWTCRAWTAQHPLLTRQILLYTIIGQEIRRWNDSPKKLIVGYFNHPKNWERASFLWHLHFICQDKNMWWKKMLKKILVYELHSVWCVSWNGEFPTISCTNLLRRTSCAPL